MCEELAGKTPAKRKGGEDQGDAKDKGKARSDTVRKAFYLSVLVHLDGGLGSPEGAP